MRYTVRQFTLVESSEPLVLRTNESIVKVLDAVNHSPEWTLTVLIETRP